MAVDQETTVVEAPDQEDASYLEMSDEEVMRLGPPMNSGTPDETQEQEEALAEKEEEEEQEDLEETPEGTSEKEEENQEASDDAQTPAPAESTKTPDAPAEKAAAATQEPDYKAAYEQIFAPFKANGREIAVKSVDDAIALMQMGANYNKKMAALKPNLKILKLLEKHELLNEEKLSYLIDLEKKNPEAINKLVKDSGINPMDLDTDKASSYTPSTYAVDEREIELDTVLEEIQSTPSYTKLLDVVGNKWDAPSKRVVADNPQLLKIINDHMASGIYDLITTEIDRERTFGRLNGLSDIEAYRQVGDAIQARGGFAHLVQNQGYQTQPTGTVTPPKPKQGDDSKLKEKKRAASSTKPALAPTRNPDFNPLSLSDEEFEKLANKKFL